MGSQVIGSQTGDSDKTPTLRQWLQTHDKVPNRCYVKTIFLPNKSGSYGLVTDTGFRVSVPETSPLFPVFRGIYDDIVGTSMCLFINVTDTGRCHWQLESCDRHDTEWEETTWGLRSVQGRLAVPVAKRAATTKGRDRNGRGGDGDATPGASLKAV